MGWPTNHNPPAEGIVRRKTYSLLRHSQILLKADANGPGGSNDRIADAFCCRTRTVEKVRQRLVERGFNETLDGTKRATPPTEKFLDGKQEARIIATRLGAAPEVSAEAPNAYLRAEKP